MCTGIIIRGIGGFYYVISGEMIYECKARGIFRKEDISPLPGDRVDFSITDTAKKTGSINRIYKRVTQLTRPSVANINKVVAVIAVKSPSPDLFLLDKLLISAEIQNIGAAICINKVDLDDCGDCEKMGDIYLDAGYDVIYTSSVTGLGYERLRMVLEGNTTVFAGQSGVGKSTILNRVMDDFVMKTGAVSEKIKRGRHTTRHAELVPLEGGGFIADTPGFSSFELSDITHDMLQDYYPDFIKHGSGCRFTHCSHVSEPGCGIREAVDRDVIDRGRYDRYVRLYDVLKKADSMKYK